VVPLGQLINVNGQPFTIVGMFTRYEGEQAKKERELAKKRALEPQAGPARRRGWGHGNWAFYRKNYTVYIPLNTAWVRFRAAGDKGGIPDNRLTDIDLKVAALDQLEPALQQARNVLMLTHRGIQDFGFRTQENQLESIDQQIRNARMSGGVIAAISLLVGGIGIMNIMLVAVTERTREIGIRKALGARSKNILMQFLLEAVILCNIGGVIGVIAGFGMGNLVVVFTHFDANVPLEWAVIGLVFCSAVGIAFGMLPALRAARLDPIEALRYE